MQPRSNVEWHKWAKEDPLYGIASRTGRSRDGDHPWTLTEFFDYGALNWSEYYPRWSRYGLDRGSCLEIGCGAGRITRQLVQCFGTVYAVDISPDMLTLARQHVDGAKFLLSDGVSVPLPDASVSAAFSCEVFQHFDDRKVALGYFREIYRVLSRGGTMMIHLPIAVLPLRQILPAIGRLQESLWHLTEKWVRSKTGIKRWLISHSNRRSFFYMVQYEPQWLFDNLTEIGFTVVEIQLFALTGDPGYQHMSSCLLARKV
jgi:SAM-dependent methyltransferase